MATEELVTEQFQFLGIDVSREVVVKCVSLCEEYDVDAETFIEQWMAFSLNQLDGAPPTLENLESLARKEFSKQATNGSNAPVKEASQGAGTGLTVYGAPVTVQPDNAVLSNYMSATPKSIKVESDSATSHQIELRPATYSPNVDRSAKYASRANPGSVVHSYGDYNLLQVINQPNSHVDTLNLNIIQMSNDEGELYTKSINGDGDGFINLMSVNGDLRKKSLQILFDGESQQEKCINPLKKTYGRVETLACSERGACNCTIRFGFELLHEKASTFDSHISYTSKCIMKKAGLSSASSVRHKTQTEVVVAGRIECDADARLNPKCVMLQGTWEDSLSQAVPVDIDNLKQYSLFPGQVVVMKGVNPRGDKFIAHEVFCDASQPIPYHKADIMNSLEGTISMLLVAGPYTTSDNMNYEPLKDLVTYISTHKPHVVIMTGPFMDSDHAKVKDNSMAETYKSFFEKLVDSLGELNSSSPYTKIYIVSSLRDAFHVNIYPTPPYSSRRKHANLNFLPDPCSLNIGGIVVGVTSTDVLMHISQEEISSGVSGDRLSRLAGHIAMQQTYYPLAGGALALDAALWAAHAQLPAAPHVLVLPATFRYFVKEVNGCVVVNPEHLTKGTGGGTFARMLISVEKNTVKIAAQILRI